MVPDNTLSSVMMPAPLIGARANFISNTLDYEDGGIALNDPSMGLKYQVWMGQLIGESVILSAPEVAAFEVHSVPGISEFSFTFDQNMRPVVAYVALGIANLWWWDSNISGMTTTALGTAVKSPKVILDDKRELVSASSDIILGYIRNENLYFRQQRDRFLIEYILAENIGIGSLWKIAMGSNLRLHFCVNPW